MSSAKFRIRFAYRKTGRLKYLSHLELIRAMERTVRRAGLPYAISEGFSPHMKCAHSWALSVGVASLCEYMDVWLTDYVAPDKLLQALCEASVSDLAPFELNYISDKEDAITKSHNQLSYTILFTPTSSLATSDTATHPHPNLSSPRVREADGERSERNAGDLANDVGFAHSSLRVPQSTSDLANDPHNLSSPRQNCGAILGEQLRCSRNAGDLANDIESHLTALLSKGELIAPARNPKKKDKHIDLNEHLLSRPSIEKPDVASGSYNIEMTIDTLVTERGMLNPILFAEALVKGEEGIEITEITRTKQAKCKTKNSNY